eukprot:7384807-Prymnesium_polylepis.1
MARLLAGLLALLALGQASALMVGTPCTGVNRVAAVRMAFPSIEDARSLSDDEIEQETFNAKKVRSESAPHFMSLRFGGCHGSVHSLYRAWWHAGREKHSART